MSDRLFVDRLAQVIRQADGDHTMGAGALADAIADSGILWELEQEAAAKAFRDLASRVRADFDSAGMTCGWVGALDDEAKRLEGRS